MRPTDLARMHTVADPQVHPDGRRIAFTVATPDLDEDTYVHRIHLWDRDGGARRFTHGPGDRAPRWSPDGGHLAFLRKGSDADQRPQLAVMPVGGGEARVITDLPLGVTDLAWSPDSTHLVVVGVEWVPDLADLDDEERARRPRRIARIPYRADDRGWTHDRRSHLWLVDARCEAPGRHRCLTPGDFDEAAPRFRPDGAAVVFVSQRHERETSPASEVYEVPVDGGEARLLVGPGLWRRPLPLDGGALLLTGVADPFGWPTPPSLYRWEPGDGLRDLSGGLDRDADMVSGPVVTAAGFLTLVEDRGRRHVYRFDGEGGHERVVGGDRVVTGVSATPDGTEIAFTATAPTDPGELWRLAGAAPQVLTAVNADLREGGDLVTTHHRVIAREGAEVDAWVLLPPGAGAGASTDAGAADDDGGHGDDGVPLLLNIHGGPTSQYGFGFFDEFQVYAAAGYAVLGINPRGSSGRGRAWARAVVGAWTDPGSVDTADLEAAVDAVLDTHPQLSRTRIGVMGGSYGGFASARLLARSDRYASAVVERALLNFVSFAGTSDIGAHFDRLFLDRTMPDDARDLWAASPMSLAHRITTPTLVLHAEDDLRCPIEQAEQLFALLRRNGVEAELLRFPGESHELSRSGSPRHRVERFEAILDWHARHLGTGGR